VGASTAADATSGMIRGIGPVYAKKLLRAFGDKVFDVIEAEPDRLARDRSNLNCVRKERVTPFVKGPHKVRLSMDCSTFAIKPFSPVGIERKMPNVIVAGLLPMLDGQ